MLPVSLSIISTQSASHSAPVCEILSKSAIPRQQNDVISIFKMADENVGSEMMGSFKCPCMTSRRSLMDTTPRNYLVFDNIAVWHCGFIQIDTQTDKQTDRRTDGHHQRMKPISLSRTAA